MAVVATGAVLLWPRVLHHSVTDAIDIAVVYSPDEDAEDFLTGIRIAVEQINAEGGVLGRPLRALINREDSYTDQVVLEKAVTSALRQAQDISNQDNVLAVIGHGSSVTAIPASAIYERAGKLFLATHATANSLSNHRLDLTFAMQPNNADNAAFLARYANSEGLRRMVVLSDNSSYGIESTDLFRSLLTADGGTVLYRGRLTTQNKSIDDLLLFLMDNELFKPSEIDAIFITSSAALETAHFISRARQLGMTMPILGPEFLFSHQVESAIDPKEMRDVVAVSVFDGNTRTAEGHRLNVAFTAAKGHPPGLMAAVAFDAVKVLARATQRTGSLDTAAIADTLRIMRYDNPYVGATGKRVFDSHGLATDTSAYVLRHDGQRFQTTAIYHKPLPQAQSDERTSVK